MKCFLGGFLFSFPSLFLETFIRHFGGKDSFPFQKGLFLANMGERGGLVAFKGEGDGPKQSKIC